MAIEWLAGKRARGTSSERPKIDFQDDFSSDGWVDTGTEIQVNTSTQVIDFECPNGATSNEGTSYDLTSTSDTQWILDFHIDLTFATNSASSPQDLWCVLSSADSASTILASADSIGFSIHTNASSASFEASFGDAETIRNNRTSFGTPTTREYYARIVRTSSTTAYIELFSDENRTTSIISQSITPDATITGLRYIKFQQYISSSTTTGTIQGTIDGVKFYNGVTSVPNTNLQDGTIFEETDTNKAYIWNASTTTWTQL
jgi:hypothetical protein